MAKTSQSTFTSFFSPEKNPVSVWVRLFPARIKRGDEKVGKESGVLGHRWVLYLELQNPQKRARCAVETESYSAVIHRSTHSDHCFPFSAFGLQGFNWNLPFTFKANLENLW